MAYLFAKPQRKGLWLQPNWGRITLHYVPQNEIVYQVQAEPEEEEKKVEGSGPPLMPLGMHPHRKESTLVSDENQDQRMTTKSNRIAAAIKMKPVIRQKKLKPGRGPTGPETMKMLLRNKLKKQNVEPELEPEIPVGPIGDLPVGDGMDSIIQQLRKLSKDPAKKLRKLIRS